ncbi:hypothetical protein PUMCH_002513 [Australozyma saopauloensis]|uniref:Elongator complex protein 1 n=1 Tax=Australozyma saopauloensis TaxID=291208 RepID=A0AAX4HA64_9ASCO|nr:hypothetical protein PUMCH_002513 [[Candida] saopauloensis]
MRNLRLLNRGRIAPQSLTYPDLPLIDAVFDPVFDTVIVALGSEEAQLIEVQQLMKDGLSIILAAFPSLSIALLAFANSPDAGELSFVFANGDIVIARYDLGSPNYETTTTEIVGLIDCGIKAAEWASDEETLSLITNENNLLVLSKSFEPIAEKQLDRNDLGHTDNKHVSVGWGKEETQFKGKGFMERERQAIKHAGLDLSEDSPLRDPTVAQVQKGSLLDKDDYSVKISWRGDSEYFAVSTVEETLDTGDLRRVIRVFSREGVLDSVSEAVDGLEQNLSWRPSGALLATTQRTTDEDGDDVLQLSFFERNGLRHGEFNTRLNPYDETVERIAWSSNSEILAVQLRSRVLLWTTKNYHWYLKQELHVDLDIPNNTISFIKFHPEKPLQLMVGTSLGGMLMYNFAASIASGPTVVGSDIGMTAVVDGTDLKITPLAVANVPPPMAYAEYTLESPMLDVSVSQSNTSFVGLLSNYNVQILTTSLENLQENLEPKTSTIEKFQFASDSDLVKQVCFIGNNCVAILIDTTQASTVVLFDITDLSMPSAICELERRAVLLKSRSDFESAIVQYIDGSVVEISSSGSTTLVSKLPTLCVDIEVSSLQSESTELKAFGLSSSGKLYCGEEQLTTGVTSFKVTENLLAFTNSHAQLLFIHLSAACNASSFQFVQTANTSLDERVRQIERGSVLVLCIPSKHSVILQAPRGNLETICPRIMVLTGVRKFLENQEYLKAFIACRTHRIDLDILYDYDQTAFEHNAEKFVQQINRVDYLDLFVSCLHQEDVTETKYRDTLLNADSLETKMNEITLEENQVSSSRKMIINKETETSSSKINKVCQIVLDILAKPQFEDKFLQTRVTAFACQAPANLKGALSLISSLGETDLQDSMITHLCFLLDVNKLYNHALELYDIKMALNIAQKSQKDPKEYLPFLQNLHVQEPLQKQFLVDDYLKNYTKALQWLADMGADANDRFYAYIVEHSLYKNALLICKYDEEKTRKVYDLYADYLFDAKNYVEAGLLYELLCKHESALESFVLCKRWKEALSIVYNIKDNDILMETATKLATALTDDHQYSLAAEITMRILGNVEESVLLYCKGYKFDSAIYLATEQNRQELLDEVVDVQLGEGFGTIAELIADCTSQSNSQLNRLRELRLKKETDPYAFYGTLHDDLDTPDNVSVAASETSTTPSFFTKYTGKTAGTAKTGASRRTSKNRKREERKRAKGRKGTVYEEEYLIKSIGRLIERLDQTETDALSLIEGLIRRQKIHQAYQIQQNWGTLTAFLKEHITEIHNMSERDRERIDDDGNVYFIDEIPIPTIKELKKTEILDF